MLKQENERNRESLVKTVNEGAMRSIRETETKLQKQIDVLAKDNTNIIAALLSVQGNQFKDRCKFMLKKEHEVTVEEYEDLAKDHEIYNALGGNHNGDELFAMVKAKFQSEISHRE